MIIQLFEDFYLCDYCYKRVVPGKVPERCFLNELEVHPIPEKMFEKMLIQECKDFQVVVRM